MPIRAITRHLGSSEKTVKRALANDRPQKYERPAKGSVVDAVEVRIRELLRETHIPLGYGQTGRPPVLVMASGYSRVITALPGCWPEPLTEGNSSPVP